MAYWKKSDDPWDRKPGQQSVNWYENDAEPVGADVPIGPSDDSIPSENDRPTPEERIRRIIEGPQPEAYTPEECPWCGQDMKRVYIFSKGFTKWSYEMPSGWLDDYEILEDVGGLFDPIYKQGSYCESCEKMTLSVKKSAPRPERDTDDFAEYARQWKEIKAREEEEARRKKKY